MTSLLDLLDRLDRRGPPRLLVFGDLILDEYVEGEAGRVSPEAPVLVFESHFSHYRLGGAGNVAANVISAGGRATCLGLVGADRAAGELSSLLEKAGVDTAGLVDDDSRPTTRKTRFVSRRHQVLRVDEESQSLPGGDAQKRLASFLDDELSGYDGLVLSDYGKGVLGDELLALAIAHAHDAGIPTLVDPKRTAYGCYRGATLITPNRDEAEVAAGLRIVDETTLAEVAERLIETAELSSIVITLGKDGIYFRTADGEARTLPTEARSIYDVTGAGDTVVAFLGLALAGGLSLEEGIRLANRAAGVVVGRFGTSAVTRAELRGELGLPQGRKVLRSEELSALLAEARGDGRRIVFTNGCFDLLHPGHIDYLTRARSYGDLLIVGVNDDASIRRAKGGLRPIRPLDERLTMLAALEAVDFLVPFADDTPEDLVERVSPDVLVKGEDWREKGVVGREWVEANGGQVVLVPLLEGFSTTELVERVKQKG